MRIAHPSLLACLLLTALPSLVRATDAPLPPFTRTDAAGWINSPPLALANLRGRVLLLDVWAFECWNCYRSFPWLNALEDHLAGEDFTVIGVHSPELAAERDPLAVATKVRQFHLRNPIMLDTDHAYWDALDNQYWPAWYVVDREGRIRGRYVGETHAGDAQAIGIETQIRQLLAHAAPR